MKSRIASYRLSALRSFGLITLSIAVSSEVLSADDWPQWRGPMRSGQSAPDAPVPSDLPKDPKPLWKLAVGGGFSSPVVAGPRLVYLDVQNGSETAHAANTRDGKELWRVAYATAFGDEWGTGPRSTPIVDGDRVYVQSCSGEFRCLAMSDGHTLWQTSFEKDFGVSFLGSKAREGTASRRGNNGCGVIEGDRLILPVGNTNGASLVCFDKRTGKVHWKSGSDEAAYSSFMSATFAGVKQVVAFTADALLGADLESGRVLWRVPLKTNAKRHAASPVIIGDTVTVNSHSLGLICFRITRQGDRFEAQEAWANTALKINLATPVYSQGHLFCSGADNDYVCVDASTGKLKWSEPGLGTGKKDYASSIVAGDRLLVLTEGGQLLLLAVNPSKYTELARIQVCGNTWSFPAYAGGRLFVRDGRELSCLEIPSLAKSAGL